MKHLTKLLEWYQCLETIDKWAVLGIAACVLLLIFCLSVYISDRKIDKDLNIGIKWFEDKYGKE